MSWIAIALCSAAVQAAINIMDKTVLHNFVRSPRTLPLFIAAFQALIGTTLILALSWPNSDVLFPTGWALLSGLLWGISSIILFHVLFSQEVSRTAPIQQTFPIFAALMAVVFIGETLSAVHWIALAATVLGAVLLSVRRGKECRQLIIHRSFLPLMLSSAIAAAAHITGKLALDGGLVVMQAHALRMLGLSASLLAWSLRPVSLREAISLIRRRSPALAVISVNELVLASAGMLLMLWALDLGPVSLVTALIATRSFFVVLYSTALSTRFPELLGEDLTSGSVALKFLAVTLIIAGVAAITAGA